MMLDFLGKPYSNEKDSVRYLQDIFDMEEVIVPKGSKGALYAKGDHFYLCPTIPVEIKDTVGSGDSFLAGFLSKHLEKEASVHETMHQSVSSGAFITSQEGACPEYRFEEFTSFRDLHKVSVLPF